MPVSKSDAFICHLWSRGYVDIQSHQAPAVESVAAVKSNGDAHIQKVSAIATKVTSGDVLASAPITASPRRSGFNKQSS